MDHSTVILRTCLVIALLTATHYLQAQAATRIGELSFLDRQYMNQQREDLGDLAGRHLGRSFNGQPKNDLVVLQLLLDNRLVRNHQTRELQAMGIILGDLLAAELKLHWVIYEDELGRSRALRDGGSDRFLFPVTMISRRREVGNETPVATIYHKAEGIITSSRPALPFR